MAVDVELAEIRDFLVLHEPFDTLSTADLDRLTPMLSVPAARPDTTLTLRHVVA